MQFNVTPRTNTIRFKITYDSLSYNSSNIPILLLPIGLFPSILPSMTSLNKPSPLNTGPIQFFFHLLFLHMNCFLLNFQFYILQIAQHVIGRPLTVKALVAVISFPAQVLPRLILRLLTPTTTTRKTLFQPGSKRFVCFQLNI